MPLDRIGFFTNPNRQADLDAVSAAAKTAREAGYSCSADGGIAGLLGLPEFSELPPQLIAAFGGDGTILRAADAALRFDAPILGVNLGRVGFLSEILADGFAGAIKDIAENKHSIERRMTLDCELGNGGGISCLNDILLYKRSFSGVVEIAVEVDGLDAGSVFCDGVIISTPTGATGYSISAGGPVIAPGLDVAIITPICPHTLCFRPIIVSSQQQMRFVFKSCGCISADGIAVADMDEGESVGVRCGQHSVKFIRFGQRNLYSLIRNKLS